MGSSWFLQLLLKCFWYHNFFGVNIRSALIDNLDFWPTLLIYATIVCQYGSKNYITKSGSNTKDGRRSCQREKSHTRKHDSQSVWGQSQKKGYIVDFHICVIYLMLDIACIIYMNTKNVDKMGLKFREDLKLGTRFAFSTPISDVM